MSLEFHSASLLFPLMDGLALSSLADDIRAHGLLEPIVLHEGKVLDGRNRLRACEAAEIEPRFAEWESNGLTPTEWVVSVNLHRRHLTTGQRAALALDLLPHLEAEAKERQGARRDIRPESDGSSEPGRSDEKAADLVGVGRSTVANAKAIQKRDPEVINGMRAGALTVAEAARAVGLTSASTNPPVSDDAPRIFYGKGDKFREATEPLVRYLAAWEKRGYEFGHVNPREAGKRLATIDSLIGSLQAARIDLEPRSHTARLTVGRA